MQTLTTWKGRREVRDGVPAKRDPVDRLSGVRAGVWVLLLVLVVVDTARGPGPTAAVFLVGAAAAAWLLLPSENGGWLGRWVFAAVCLGAAVAHAVAGGDVRLLPPDGDLLFGLGLLAAGALVAVGHRRVHRAVVPYPVANPFVSGTYVVTAGGAAVVNHHAAAANQRFALDLVRARPLGPRTRGVIARSVEDYLCYGDPVVSPVAGRVVGARDGLPDRGASLPLYGNCVFIEPEDRPGWQLRIAHLRPGTVAVAIGDRVGAGQPLGEIGNSGNSSEPHLHLHLQDDRGRGVPLRFPGRRRPLWRNDRLVGRAPDGVGPPPPPTV